MSKSKALRGALLIFIGLVLILNSTHLVSIDLWGSIMDLWPVFIIAAGITFFLNRESHIPRVVLWILVFALILGYGIYLSMNSSESELDKTFEMKAGIQSGSFEINLGAAKFDLDARTQDLAGIKTSLKGLTFVYNEGVHPKITYNQKGQFNALKGKQDFKASLNPTIPWKLEINSGASEGTLNFSDLILESCTVNTGACDLDIVAGSKQEEAQININAGAADIKVKLPMDVGLRITSDTVITQVKGTVNMAKEGNILFSDNYANSPYKLNLNIASAALEITVNH